MIKKLFSAKVLEQLAIAVMDWLKEQARSYFNRAKDSVITTVTILSVDDLYMPLVEWLQKNNFDKTAKSYRYRTVQKGRDRQPVMGPDYGNYSIKYNGHTIWINVGQGDKKMVAAADGEMGAAQNLECIKLSCVGASDPLVSILNEVFEEWNNKALNYIELRYWDSYGSWSAAGRLLKRKETKVIMKDGLLDFFYKDISDWKNSEAWYAEREVPYRRGYVLYGPPGTGKTSLVKHLGAYFCMNVHVLTAGSLNSSSFTRAIRNVSENSIILIEDVDCFFKARTKKDATLVDFSTLLNTLDGVVSMENIIVIMTTNNIDDLDAALIRPGRIDKVVEIPLCTTNQAQRLLEKFFPGSTEIVTVKENLISPAEIQEICLSSGNAKEAAAQINKFKKTKRKMPTETELLLEKALNATVVDAIAGVDVPY